MIPYGKQSINQDDIDAVVEVLQSDFLTQGPKVPEFEAAVARYVNADYAVATNSATSALHIACLALDLGEGDCLWTSPITFVASANCARYCGASVDFVDIDPDTYNLSPKALERKLKQARVQGCLPKVVVPVHLSGQSCDMAEIARLSEEYGFSIIEDASHAIGGSYQGQKIGNGCYSDITIFSFHPVKVMTTAEGGMAVTSSQNLAERMQLYRSHGITRDPELMIQRPEGPWYYEQVTLGFNYRMTELQAALGIKQLARLDGFVTRRHFLANRYAHLLADKPLILPRQLPNTYSALHLYIIRLNLKQINKTHKDVFETLRKNGIGVNLHYIPVYRQPYYQSEFSKEDYPTSEAYYASAISLPLYYSMSESQQDEVVATLEAVLNDSGR